MDDDYEIFYFLLLFLFAILVIASASFLIDQPDVTGRVIAVGGAITRADITKPLSPASWIGVYGNLTGNISFMMNSSFSPGQMTRIQVYGDGNSTQLLISLSSEIDPSTLVPATHGDIDAFIDLPSSHPLSSQNTFIRLMNFSIFGTMYELISLKTNSFLGDYYTGALKDADGLIFVTNIYPGLGWANNSIDFQTILPLHHSGNATYYFSSENSTAPSNQSFALNCTDISIRSSYNATDGTIVLQWNHVNGASAYQILIINDTEILNFSHARTVPVIGTRWTDGSLGFHRRYYQIAATSSTEECRSDAIIGASNISLYHTPESPYNLISFPFIYANASIPEVLASIDGQYTRLYEFNNSIKSYSTFIYGIYDAIRTIRPGAGYWIEITGDLNLVTTGIVNPEQSEELTVPYNLLGFAAIAVDRSVYSMLGSIDGSYTRVYEFNNSIKSYNTFIYGIYDAIHTLQPDFGYWVEMSENRSLVIP